MRKRKTPAKTKRLKKPGNTAPPQAVNRAAEATGAVTGKSEKPVAQPAIPARISDGFPIVGIGSSAGGLEALEELFLSMPPDSGMAFVVVSHLHPGHTSMLPELLGKTTKMPVMEARDGVLVRPNHIYVSPAAGYLTILNGTLHRIEVDTKKAANLPINYFLRSLATDQKEKAICIILSGTGSDGTLGLKEIKAELGMCMVQQIESAKYGGMPASAIATGLADFVLPPTAMPKQLVAYAKGHPLLSTPSPGEEVPEPLQKIFVLMRAHTGHDFSGYKTSTIRRRIARRMNLHQMVNPLVYVRYLQENPEEIDNLSKEMLIGVTSFFRDAAAFESLGKTALPALLNARPDNYSLRIWVPGCATGEEVYSLAILLNECMTSLNRHFNVQIFGTDLDSDAVQTARTGQYPEEITVDVSPKRLERYFVRDGNTYRIRKDIREMTVFAVQNVIKDAPFTKLDLISCRNLLIYLTADVQKKLLPLFHYALKPGGLLFLGPSESVGNFHDLFELIDKRWKIYRRKETALSLYPALEFPVGAARDTAQARLIGFLGLKETNIAGSVERLLLGRFAPASVVVNSRGDALYFHGRTGNYLEPAAGRPHMNILDMAREGLQLELSAALRHAAAQNKEVVRQGVRVKTNGEFTYIDIVVSKIREPENLLGLFLVTFRPVLVSTKPGKAGEKDGERSRVTASLERELLAAKESLQSTIEELETSNEELKSTNEELQSTNEELQSANEELETSREEMQSLNEELSTVNSELQAKVDELSRTNDDMKNLLNSTEIATIFLDSQLNITRYTEQAKHLVNLIQSDIGRPLADLVSNLKYERMVADCKEVLRTLAVKQKEVLTNEGHWYLMRIMPYRSTENIIGGLVLTFVDINPVKQAQKGLRRMSRVFIDALDPIVIVDLQGRIIDLNEQVVRSFGWTRNDLMGQPVSMLTPTDEHSALQEWLKKVLQSKTIRNVEYRRIDNSGHEYNGLLTLSLITDNRDQPEAIAMTIKDIVA